MKKECEIVKDLLPLYIDQLSSDTSNDLIEKHLKKCAKCQKEYQILSSNLKLELTEKDKKDYRKSFNKTKKKYWFRSIIIAIWIVTLSFLLISGQYQNIPALNFDSLKIINQKNKFLQAIKEYDYEKMDELLYIPELHSDSITEGYRKLTKEDFFNNIKLLNQKEITFTKIKLHKIEWLWGDSYWKGNSFVTYRLYYKYDTGVMIEDASILLTFTLNKNNKLMLWADTYAKNEINNFVIDAFNRRRLD